jgi:cytochrome c oxidase assembly factor CtaG
MHAPLDPGALAPGAVLASWSRDPAVLGSLLATGAIYVRGWLGLRRQMPHRFGAGRLAAFVAGLGTIAAALVSPLDALAPLLLQAHMAQHLLLTMVAPPLIWLGAPAIPLLRGLPWRLVKHGIGPVAGMSALRRLARRVTHPAAAWVTFAAVTWAWHAPALYEAALRSPAWHVLEHLSFLAAALLFWWPVIQPWPASAVWPRWAMIPYLLLADVQNTVLSAGLTFAERVVYPWYAAVPRPWGIGPLEDQAAAGAIMWVAGSIAFLLPLARVVSQLLQPGHPVPDGAGSR